MYLTNGSNFKVVFNFLIALCFISSCIISEDLMDGMITSKIFAFSFILVLLLLTLNIFSISKRTSFYINVNLIDILVVLYGLYICFQTIIIKNNLSSIYIVEFYALIIFYFTCRILLGGNYILDFVIIVFIGQGFLQIFYGITQLLHLVKSNNGDFVLTGSFYNPAPFAGFLISIFPLSLVIYFYGINFSIHIRKLCLYFCLGVIIILPFTLSRSSWVSVIFVSLLIYNFRNNLINKAVIFFRYYYYRVFGLLLILFIVVASLFFMKRDSAEGRLLIWKITSTIVKDKFIYGHGFHTFPLVYDNFQYKYFASQKRSEKEQLLAGDGEFAFNDILELIVEQGIIGLIFILLMFYVVIIKSGILIKEESKINPLCVGAALSIVAICCFSLFSYPFSILPIKVNLIFCISIISTFNFDRIYTVPLTTNIRYILFVIALLLIIPFTKIQVIRYSAFSTWGKLKKEIYIKKDLQALIDFKKIYPILKGESNFLYDYGLKYYVLKDYKNSIRLLEKAKINSSEVSLYTTLGNIYGESGNLKLAEENYLHAVHLIPHKFYPKYLLANYYEEIGNIKLAKQMANEILNMKIKVPSPTVNKIRQEMKLLLD